MAAGVLLTVITLMTCVSLLGRNTIGRTHRRRLRAVGLAAGAAIALFLPWCQIRRGNIIVDFFTAQASRRTKRTCSIASARCCSLLAMALMTWRTTIGGLNAWKSQSGTMMIGFPEWIIYTAWCRRWCCPWRSGWRRRCAAFRRTSRRVKGSA